MSKPAFCLRQLASMVAAPAVESLETCAARVDRLIVWQRRELSAELLGSSLYRSPMRFDRSAAGWSPAGNYAGGSWPQVRDVRGLASSYGSLLITNDRFRPTDQSQASHSATCPPPLHLPMHTVRQTSDPHFVYTDVHSHTLPSTELSTCWPSRLTTAHHLISSCSSIAHTLLTEV